MIATAAGATSNLELTLPIIVLIVLFVGLWDDLMRFLSARLDEASELLGESQDSPPLRALNGSRPTGAVERRPEERERARRERAEARLSSRRAEGKAS